MGNSGSTRDLLAKGEPVVRALKWLAEERLHRPDVPRATLINEASIKFDLSPLAEQFLLSNWGLQP